MRLLPVPRLSYADDLQLPAPGISVPRRGSRLTKLIGCTYLSATGWRFEGSFPDVPKMVLIVAPHTANADFMVGIAALFALGIRVSWMGKHTIFWEPFGTYLRWLGGIPVDRRAPHGVVGELRRTIDAQEQFILGITPEGTRSKAERWKMGFYYIAQSVRVPIFPVAFDFGPRVIRFGQLLWPSGQVDQDMRRLGAFYEGVQGANPELFTPPVAVGLPRPGRDNDHAGSHQNA